MKIGMLWFDNDPKSSITVKIERAALYYRNKYGQIPTLCFVHPSMVPKEEAVKETSAKNSSENGKSYVAGGLEVRLNQAILPNHFWIGVNGNPTIS